MDVDVNVEALPPVFNHKRNELMSAVPDISRCDNASLMTSRTVSVGLTDNVLVYSEIKREREKNKINNKLKEIH